VIDPPGSACNWTADDGEQQYRLRSGGENVRAGPDACRDGANPMACSMRWSRSPINYTFAVEPGKMYQVRGGQGWACALFFCVQA
jgi:hypothetical protein